jgi:hypothetical protein
VATLPGGGELGLAGPVFNGGRTLFAWVDGGGTVHVQAAGATDDLWSAPAPAPPPPSSPTDTSIRTVTQRVAGLAAGSGGVAVVRAADLTVEPACVIAVPACELAVAPQPYAAELAAGRTGGALSRQLGFGPLAASGCPPTTALTVTDLAASDPAFAAALQQPQCYGRSPTSPARIVVRMFTGKPVVTLRVRSGVAIDAVAIAGRRWLAWLAHNLSPTGTSAAAAVLVLYDLKRQRVTHRWPMAVPGSQGPAAARLAIERNGRIALLIPGPDSAPCEANARLFWTSLAHTRLHPLAQVAPASPLALARGRALVELPHPNPTSGCPEPGSIAAVDLASGTTTTLAVPAPNETPTGDLAWNGRRAGFAVIVPTQTSGGQITYRTSIRVAPG